MRLFDDHVDAVYAYLARRLGPDLAPETVGETFDRAIRSWDRFDPNDGSERSYLYTHANVVLRHREVDEQHRFRNWSHRTDTSGGNRDPLVGDGSGAEAERIAFAMEAVADLAPDDRDVLLLVLWERCNQTTVADTLEVPVGTIRSTLARSRRELKARGVRQDAIETARPDVDPLPAAERRRIREGQFEVGDDDVARSIGRRSVTGAVVSTAPTGTMAYLKETHPRRGSWLRIGLGLVLAAIVGGVVWFGFVDQDDGDEVATADSSAPTTGRVTTVATTAPPTTVERTGVSRSMPLVLPPVGMPIEQATVDRPPAGSTAALFQAQDGTMLWAFELDGPETDTSDLEVTQVGALEISTRSDIADAEQPTYGIVTACGTVQLFDSIGQAPFRAEVNALLGVTTVAEGNITFGLPAEWIVVDDGDLVDSYRMEIPVEVGGQIVIVRFAQAPDGSFAQYAFGARQFAPTTFLGETAWVAQPVPGRPQQSVDLMWRDGDTVFQMSADGISIEDAAELIRSFEPASLGDWEARFGLVEPTTPTETGGCEPQPSFTVNP